MAKAPQAAAATSRGGKSMAGAPGWLYAKSHTPRKESENCMFYFVVSEDEAQKNTPGLAYIWQVSRREADRQIGARVALTAIRGLR